MPFESCKKHESFPSIMGLSTGWQDGQSEFELQVNNWVPFPASVCEDSDNHPTTPQNPVQNHIHQILKLKATKLASYLTIADQLQINKSFNTSHSPSLTN